MHRLKHLLLNNHGTKQTLVKNSLWLGLIEAAAKGIMFVVTVGLVRYWGAKEFGNYNLAFAQIAIFMILADFGLSTITVREIAKDKTQSEKYLGNLFGLKLALSVLISVLFLGTYTFILKQPVSPSLLIVTLIYNLTQGFQGVCNALFQAWEKMEFIFVNRLVYYLGILGVALATIHFHGNATQLVLGYAGTTLLATLLGIWQIHLLDIKIRVRADLNFWKKQIREAFPLLGITTAAAIYANGDTLLIGKFLGSGQVGFYQAAYKIFFAFQSINIVNNTMFPRITILLHEKKLVTAKKLIKLVIGLSLLGLIPLALTITFARNMIMHTIYGSTFVVSASVMSLLIWAGVINYFGQFTSNLLIAKGKQHMVFYAILLGTLTNLLLNYLLIPKFGIVQGGISMIVSEMVILTTLAIMLLRGHEMWKLKSF